MLLQTHLTTQGENPGACMFHAQMRLSLDGCRKLSNFLSSSNRVRALSLSHNYLGACLHCCSHWVLCSTSLPLASFLLQLLFCAAIDASATFGAGFCSHHGVATCSLSLFTGMSQCQLLACRRPHCLSALTLPSCVVCVQRSTR